MSHMDKLQFSDILSILAVVISLILAFTNAYSVYKSEETKYWISSSGIKTRQTISLYEHKRNVLEKAIESLGKYLLYRSHENAAQASSDILLASLYVTNIESSSSLKDLYSLLSKDRHIEVPDTTINSACLLIKDELQYSKEELEKSLNKTLSERPKSIFHRHI